MSAFTDLEIAYLTTDDRPLGRVATVGPGGMPHVVPCGVRYNPDDDSLDISGMRLETTKKYRDIARTGVAAVVLDDVLPPWRPRGIEVRARAELIEGSAPLIRLHPRRIVSWGLEGDGIGDRHARDVS